MLGEIEITSHLCAFHQYDLDKEYEILRVYIKIK